MDGFVSFSELLVTDQTDESWQKILFQVDEVGEKVQLKDRAGHYVHFFLLDNSTNPPTYMRAVAYDGYADFYKRTMKKAKICSLERFEVKKESYKLPGGFEKQIKLTNRTKFDVETSDNAFKDLWKKRDQQSRYGISYNQDDMSAKLDDLLEDDQAKLSQPICLKVINKQLHNISKKKRKADKSNGENSRINITFENLDAGSPKECYATAFGIRMAEYYDKYLKRNQVYLINNYKLETVPRPEYQKGGGFEKQIKLLLKTKVNKVNPGGLSQTSQTKTPKEHPKTAKKRKSPSTCKNEENPNPTKMSKHETDGAGPSTAGDMIDGQQVATYNQVDQQQIHTQHESKSQLKDITSKAPENTPVYSPEQQKLIDNRVVLTQEMEPSNYKARLIQDGIISVDDEEELDAFTTRKKRAEWLLSILKTKKGFIPSLAKAMEENGQKHLADLLTTFFN